MSLVYPLMVKSITHMLARKSAYRAIKKDQTSGR